MAAASAARSTLMGSSVVTMTRPPRSSSHLALTMVMPDELVSHVVAEGVPLGRLVEADGRARVADVQVENVVRDLVKDGSSRG
jgi:hypothetical protein